MSTAKDILLPPSGVFRTAYLYVGQGDATLHVIPNGLGGVLYCLVDINRNQSCGGLDVVGLLEDLLPRGTDGKPVLDVFINTHPHNDHLCGVDELSDRVTVGEVWHTGFVPSEKHATTYAALTKLTKQVERRGGRVWEYAGTRDEIPLGAVGLNVLSPAPHMKAEVDELSGKERDCRIHDHCGVVRFGYGPSTERRHVLDTGDSDKVAWSEYILGPTEYHKERVKADVLSAPHHGSRSFFMLDEDDPNVYTRHMELIAPSYVVISSPKREDSPHGHPHEKALELYKRFVSPQNVRVLGDRPECLMYDVYENGVAELWSDNGQLVDAYPLDDPGAPGGSSTSKLAAPAIFTSRVDRGRPMGKGGR
jgi:beta-lactamase superfamily II metal-dependent hydrolase